MRPIRRIEPPLSAAAFAVIAAALTRAQQIVSGFDEVDLSRGVGVVDDETKCLWTRDGLRIEVWFKRGSAGASKSRAPDPSAPPKSALH